MSSLTLGSLFDGSGGFPLAALLSGITPIWASEIEPFPIRVTTKRLPFVKHYGDIRKMNGGEIEPVDIITFGSPCTDLSLAGRRMGINGKQSSLFFEAIRIIQEMRNATHGTKPRYIIFENVPGIFSSGGGSDFKEVLESFCRIKDETVSVPQPKKWLTAGEILADDYSVAWRTIDAQFFNTAQRRVRCYLVADFDGQRASKILFEFEGMSGYTPPCLYARETVTADTAGSVGATDDNTALAFEPGAMSRLGGHTYDDYACTLRAKMGDNQLAVAIPINMQVATRCNALGEGTGLGVGEDGDPAYTLQAAHSHAVVIHNHPSDSRIDISEDGIVQTLTKKIGGGGNNTPYVMELIPQTLKIRSGSGNGGRGALIQDDKSATLSCNNDQTVFVPSAYCLQGNMIGREIPNGPNGSGVSEDTAYTLTKNDKHAVAYSLDRASYNQGQNAQYDISIQEEQSQTLVAKGPHAVAEHTGSSYVIRRLTPQECAMLQGFPPKWCDDLSTPDPTDDEISWWTQVFAGIGKTKTRKQVIKWLRNPHSDSAEYSMWGNAICVNCGHFVLSGIAFFAGQ